MKIRMETKTLKQTEALARGFSQILKPPMVVLLKGDLGSGKTTFVKCIAKALGCKELVNSPTFTLLNTYNCAFPIYHFDMYRLSNAQEARDVGFEQYFDLKQLNGVCFVEWPENVEGLIKYVSYIVEIKKTPKGRIFDIEEGK